MKKNSSKYSLNFASTCGQYYKTTITIIIDDPSLF
jgi:hypothetical protein